MLVRLALIATTLLASAACQAPASPVVSATPSSGVQPGGAFRTALSADIATLDPWNANDPNSLLVTRQIFETLVEYEPGSFRIVPKLARSWSVSPDGRMWTFVLRSGVKFHDGTDLDAAGVALNLERARLRDHPLRGATSPDRFRTYASLLEGFDDAGIVTRVDAPDASTVTITTRTPFGPLLADLAMPSFAIVSPASIRADPSGWATPASAAVAGTGPFVFRVGAWQREQQVTLERNAAYWARDRFGAALPYVDRIVFRPIRDETARIAEMRRGELDAVREITPGAVPTVSADPNLGLSNDRALGVAYLGISQLARPFDRIEVRRAIAMAVDKQLLAITMYAGNARGASQLLVPGMLGYDDSVVEFYRYDTAAAKRLLVDAGFPSGFTTELWYPATWRSSYPEPRRVADSIAADLARIGIVATVRAMDAAALRTDARADRVPLWLGELAGASADPDAFFPDGGAWAGDVVRELLRRARYEADASKRTELYKQVSKLIQQDAARIPLVHADTLVAASKKVRGLMLDPIGVEAYTAVWLGK